MTPYRSNREERPAIAPETGLVADMVRQFADPYAFLRELAQNGLDAGASRIEVRVELPAGAAATTRVTDDGAGMSRATIEGPLLTLFSSSKEESLDMIGRYGVGFVSVFALAPEEVQIETWQPGSSYLVRLFPDHRYELLEGRARPGSGTVVTVIKAMDRQAFLAHAGRCKAALLRWCRHAERPIRLFVYDLGAEETSGEIRIDRPVGVFAPISVTRTIARKGGGEEIFSVGVSPGSAHLDAPAPDAASALERADSFAGFYNRGLTLLETNEPLSADLAGLRFKVISPHLSHTISRDDVRRDADFARVIEVVRRLAREPLREALVKGLADAALGATRGETTRAYAAMLEAASLPPMSLPASEIRLPLASPVGGARVLAEPHRDLPKGHPILVSARRDAITDALAAAWIPVVLAAHPAVGAALQRLAPRAIEEAQEVYLLVRERDPSSLGEEALGLLDALAAQLRAAGAPVARAGLGAIEGALDRRAAVVIPEGPAGAARLCSTAQIAAWYNRWSSNDILLLNPAGALWNKALGKARRAPPLAAHVLARALLAGRAEAASAKASDLLLALAGEALRGSEGS
ncbi:MAG: ATP-binding protein [Byssovorax sp.]